MDVAANVRNGEYINRLVYPTQPRQPLLARNATPTEIRAYADLKEQYEEEFEVFKALRKAYNAETARLEAKFREDLEIEYNMVGHPKADKLFAKAWEMGHGSGLNDVAIYYDDLYELVA